MKYFFRFLGFVLLTTIILSGNPLAAQENRSLSFPDIPGYQILVCDFHQHTVFSDGEVWPSIRVQEAYRHGMDAIAITDHIEYQPHREDIPHPDRNRSYELAKESSSNHDIIVVNGAEITREMPPGHANAIFLKDANKLSAGDPTELFREADKQGAFIFWNHPSWVAHRMDGVARLDDMHRQLLREGLIHGIEIVNGTTYSENAHQMAIEHKLTLLGSSDIHGLIDWKYNQAEGKHRPVTLVFAAERTEAALKDGLFNGRTAVWFNNTLIGEEQYLVPLITNSLSVEKVKFLESYKGKSTVQAVSIENRSGADFILKNESDYTLHSHSDLVVLKAHETTRVEVKTLKPLPSFELRFEVWNALIAPKKHPEIVIQVETD